MTYSHSQLETFEACPLKYRLQYLERIKAGRRGIEAFMGSVVHATLEKLYRDLRMSRLPGPEEVGRYFLDQWEAGFGDDIFIVRSEYRAEDYRETGLRCVQEYYARYHPFTGGVPIWLEKMVRIPLYDAEGRQIDFVGVLDRLDGLEEGRYEIHDYKTSQTLPTREQLEKDRQLSLYQLAVEKAFPDAREVELVWHYLVFGRELRLKRERRDLDGVAAAAVEVVQRIESSQEFPPRESELCEWCEFQEYCPRRKHLFMTASLPVRELGMDRGIQLVDQYAEWQARKKEAEDQIELLRRELLEFADFHGVDNIRGSFKVLSIRREMRPKLPPPGSAEREAVEEALKREGVWEKVSVLNAQKLASLLSSGSLDESRRARLEEVITCEEVPTLRLRKMEGQA
ncbi:MAG: PD-(D/E)XK nuclease family protein [Actinobacteria bacterium]|nr:PD-(D/E)XK nuclease family protein [Actinomycetota bacterium]